MIAILAWLALPAAAFFSIQSDREIGRARLQVRAFDLHARETTDELAELRAGEQAYVADGQGALFWMPKVSSSIDAIGRALDSLTRAASTIDARAALQEASSAFADFTAIDRRAREYIKAGQALMASDVIFSEGGTTVAAAARQIESARLAEQQMLDRAEADRRRIEAFVLAGVAVFLAAAILLLVRGRIDPVVPAAASGDSSGAARSGFTVGKNVAALCTEFGRVRDLPELQRLLGKMAEAMEATGLIVWIGDTAGADLQPALAHGYSVPALARMRTVPRNGANAAAAAYRTGELQLVRARTGPRGPASGAVVAPILSAEGCIGALTAEIRAGGEASENIQALASVFAAQLSTMFVTSPPVVSDAEPQAVRV
jgi:hypothetical protein